MDVNDGQRNGFTLTAGCNNPSKLVIYTEQLLPTIGVLFSMMIGFVYVTHSLVFLKIMFLVGERLYIEVNIFISSILIRFAESRIQEHFSKGFSLTTKDSSCLNPQIKF